MRSVARLKPIWDLLRQLLTSHGHPASLDRIAYDPDEGWRIHFLAADPGLVAAMHAIAGEARGPGDLSAFDAHDQVRDWLRRIEDRIVYLWVTVRQSVPLRITAND